jgi:hypothetical protein
MPTLLERVLKIEEECRGCWGQSGINQWERDRLAEWKHRHSISPKQEETLCQIERKAFANQGED